MSFSSDRRLSPGSLAGLAALLAGLLCLAGCATTGESDIPWNSPQPWEGSPTVPGLPRY